MGITVFAAAACFRRSAASGSVVDNFNRANGALGTRSDSGAWTLLTGTAPVISSNTLIAGAAAGAIAGTLGKQNATYACDITTTVGTFTPVLRIMSDGSATTNYLGIAIDTTGAAFGVTVFSHLSGGFAALVSSTGAVFTTGVAGTLSITITGATSAVVLNAKFNGTDIPGLALFQTSTSMNAVAALGGTYTGPDVAASAVTYDNFSAT